MTTCSRSSARGTSGPPQSWHALAFARRVGAALRADHAGGKPADDFRLAQHNLDDDERSPSGDDFVERTRLGDGPWKPVEQEAPLRVRLREPLGHHARDDLVVNQAAGFHDRRDFAAERGPAWTASRSIAPVEMCGMFHLLRSWRACVPLPAPGGPSITKLSSIQH